MRRLLLFSVVFVLVLISFQPSLEWPFQFNTFTLPNYYPNTLERLFSFREDFFRLYDLTYNQELVKRKAGHFFAYGFLSILVYWNMGISNIGKRTFFAWFMTSTFGVMDEIHQFFIMNRTGSVLDVAINSLGSLNFVLLILCFHALGRMHINTRKDTITP